MERRIYIKLQELRQKQAVAQRERTSTVASNTLLKAIAHNAPTTEQLLQETPGFRGSGLEDLSTTILAFIKAARDA